MSKVTSSSSSSPLSSLSSADIKAKTPDELRALIAQWAIKQAEDPNVGYSQDMDKRVGQDMGGGRRDFDCSGLCDAAYKAFGINSLGTMNTSAMKANASSFATKVPIQGSMEATIASMKPGDLVVMDGHVVMYTGGGKCVAACTDERTLKDQVVSNMDVSYYLSGRAEPNPVVLRPNVSASEVAAAPASAPLQSQGGPAAGPSASSTVGSSSGPLRSAASAAADGTSNSSTVDDGANAVQESYAKLLETLKSNAADDAATSQQLLAKLFPKLTKPQLAQLTTALKANPGLIDEMQKSPAFAAAVSSSPALVKAFSNQPELAKALATPEIQAALKSSTATAGQISTLLTHFADSYQSASGKGPVDIAPVSTATPTTQVNPALMADIQANLPRASMTRA